MTPENFAYWLQGLLEVGQPESLDKVQTQQIKDHLQLVFRKETPIVLNNIPQYTNDNDDLIGWQTTVVNNDGSMGILPAISC